MSTRKGEGRRGAGVEEG